MKLLYDELGKDLVRPKEETKEISKITYKGTNYVLPHPIRVPLTSEYQDVIVEIVRQWQKDRVLLQYYEAVRSEDWAAADDDPPFPLPF